MKSHILLENGENLQIFKVPISNKAFCINGTMKTHKVPVMINRIKLQVISKLPVSK